MLPFRQLSPQRRLLLKFIACLLLGFVCFQIEEYFVGLWDNHIGNQYSHTVYVPINRVRQQLEQQIVVLVVVEESGHLSEYQLPLATLKCYCAFHRYPFVLMDLSINATLREKCPQTDFMFRRHCAVAIFMEEHTNYDYLLFADADMAVINTNHLLEDYLHLDDPLTAGVDLIFSERIFTNEIMAGSYFVKNTEYAREFLNYWADYHFVYPDSFGTDNSAIHGVWLDRFCVNCSRQQRAICNELWHESNSFESLLLYTSCMRSIMGDRNLYIDEERGGRALLLTNTKDFWCRDGWLTNNKWSSNDFVLHGWQKRRRDRQIFAHWHSPLSREVEFSQQICSNSSTASLNWPYKDSFMTNDKEIDAMLKAEVYKAKNDFYLKHLQQIYKRSLLSGGGG